MTELTRLIRDENEKKRQFEAGIHGVPLDGGSAGSGLAGTPPDPSMDPSDNLHYDPTQEHGTDAWQIAKMIAEKQRKKQLEDNAQDRRN